MRKIFWSALLGVFLSLGAFVSARAEGTLRIAYQPSPLYAPLFVAKANHWVEEEAAKAGGARIEWAVFAAGPAMNESFAAGQQDIGLMGDTPALIGKAVGIDTRVVGLSVSGPKGQGVLVASRSPIEKLGDLKGKKIAVTKGSFAQHFLTLVLEKAGLTEKDVSIINMQPAEIPSAVIVGAVDAGITWEPYLTRFETDGAVRVLVDGTGLKSGVQPILATAKAVSAKSELIRAFLRAYARGAEAIREDPVQAAKWTAKDCGLPPALLEKVFAKQTFAPPLNDAAVGEFKKTEAYMQTHGLLRKKVDVDAWVIRSFVP
ncbi:MAG: aliphatic sulfonate ABC transporter substrate-binding protein [Alphaproteobacteria bacterium]|nr:aliphatic sulfonate ABC transporter substrate-binding protein [Alphaproteobacteria bacterium]